MNIKTLILNFILMLVAAAIAAVLVTGGTQYLESTGEDGEKSALFTSQAAEAKKHLQFVEIKNLVITLKSNSVKERYLLLDLALTTHDDTQSQRAENLLPKIKGIAVDVLTSMDYSEVRGMSVMELRALMMERYQSAFHNISVTIPFDDVTISKMVFQ
nr:flagellar basal body-associated FliL family protein [uncultured Erwinia sp.]